MIDFLKPVKKRCQQLRANKDTNDILFCDNLFHNGNLIPVFLLFCRFLAAGVIFS